MRLSITMLGLAAGAAALSACGGNDRAAAITKAEADCATTMATGLPPSIDKGRLCTCIVTRLSEGKDAGQIRTTFASSEPPPEAMTTVSQCAAEAMGAAPKK